MGLNPVGSHLVPVLTILLITNLCTYLEWKSFKQILFNVFLIIVLNNTYKLIILFAKNSNRFWIDGMDTNLNKLEWKNYIDIAYIVKCGCLRRVRSGKRRSWVQTPAVGYLFFFIKFIFNSCSCTCKSGTTLKSAIAFLVSKLFMKKFSYNSKCILVFSFFYIPLFFDLICLV